MITPRAAADLARKVRAEGPRETAKRLARRAYLEIGAASLDFPLLPGDVADSAAPARSAPSRRTGPRLDVGWVTTPPSAGSGGHTTMFRMVEALERAGHRCTILLYDRHHGDVHRQAEVIRAAWPRVRAEVCSVDDGFGALDACVATSWPTAHVLARRTRDLDVHRFYLVQDFEPFFHPRGSEYELAADTYRFGFTNIALGHMVQDRLRSELGVGSEVVPFSCDTDVYRLVNRGPRAGIVLYAKPDVARRGYRLGALALEAFHREHPDQEIHVYGEPVPEISVPVTRHGRMSPDGLNKLYNEAIAGLAMSFTNISLVAEEMLAAGCIPVVNDSPDARADLDNPHVAWCRPTPSGVAAALGAAVDTHRRAGSQASDAAAASVRTDNWRVAGDRLVGIVEAQVRGEVAGRLRPGA